VAVGDPWGNVKLWDADKKQLLKNFSLGKKKKIERVDFSRDGKWLAYYVEGVLHLVDVGEVRKVASVADEKK
jgi:hypothetical protein